MLTRSIGVLSTLILARLLLTEDFGLVAMATTFAASVEALSQLGLQDALVRRRSEGMEQHDTAFTLQLGRAFLTGGIIAAGAPFAAQWFAEPRLTTVLLILAGATVIGGFENVGLAEYRRAMRFDVQFRMLLTRRIVSFAFTISAALIFHSYFALLIGIVAGTLVWVAMSYVLHPFRPRLSLTYWRELAHFSSWTWAATMASLVWDRCDTFILGPVFGSAGLGLYLLAMEIALLPVTEVIAPASDALFSAFARSQKDGESSLALSTDVSGMILILVAPIILVISTATGPIIEVLLGSRWAEAWYVAAVLTWLCLFSPFSFIASNALVANGFVRQNFWAKVCNSAVRLSLLIATVFVTTDMQIIGAITVLIVFLEGAIYLVFLYMIGRLPVRSLMGATARVGIALAAAAATASASGLAWRPGTGMLLPNILRCAELSAIIVSVFGAVMAVTWYSMGRPTGPEIRLLQLAPTRLQPLCRRITAR